MTTDTRIESLETQVRTLKRMLFGVFGLVVVGGLLAATTLQSVPDVIQAKKFEVVNDEGRPVAALYADEDGGGGLRIYNNAERTLAILAKDSLGMFNKDGKLVANLSVTEFGGLSQVRNNDGTTAAAIGASPSGGVCYMYDKSAIPYFSVKDYKTGGVLQLTDDEGKTSVALGAMDERGGGLDILNKDGKRVAGIYITKEEGGLLEISGKDGMPCAEVGVTADGGMVGLQFRDGKPGGGFAVMKEVGGTLLTINREGEVTSITPAPPELP